jgi:type IV secretory pathway TraG/TraD family ATPase VirD4
MKIIYFKDRFFMSRISKKIPIPKQMPNMPTMSKNKQNDSAKKDGTNSSASSSESSSGGSLN